jgi:hypothetical protein
MKFVKTISAMLTLLALCNCSGASTATTSAATDIREARLSMVASFRNFFAYCRREHDALSWTVRYDIEIIYYERQYLDYGPVIVQDIAQKLRKNYEEGYYKYRELWCANIASMAIAISESIDEWGPPLTTPGEACRLHPTMQFCINRSKAK